jgi:hypothetical protein
MVAYFVNQHMGHDLSQRFAMLGPVIEDGPPIEENHIGQAAGLLDGLLVGKSDTLEQSEKIVLAFGLHLVEDIVAGKIRDADEQLAAQRPEFFGKPAEGVGGQRLEIFERRRFEPG